jgi:hypothetical protein
MFVSICLPLAASVCLCLPLSTSVYLNLFLPLSASVCPIYPCLCLCSHPRTLRPLSSRGRQYECQSDNTYHSLVTLMTVLGHCGPLPAGVGNMNASLIQSKNTSPRILRPLSVGVSDDCLCVCVCMCECACVCISVCFEHFGPLPAGVSDQLCVGLHLSIYVCIYMCVSYTMSKVRVCNSVFPLHCTGTVRTPHQLCTGSTLIHFEYPPCRASETLRQGVWEEPPTGRTRTFDTHI